MNLDWVFLCLGVAVITGIVVTVYNYTIWWGWILGFGAGIGLGMLFILIGTILDRDRKIS